jgi:hypothetical protein
MLPSGQKLTLGPLATSTVEVVPFPALLPFLKCILDVFCEDVQQLCLSHLSCVKMAVFLFYL